MLPGVELHASAWPFLLPVDPADVPDYYDLVKYPMDLRTMTERHKARLVPRVQRQTNVILLFGGYFLEKGRILFFVNPF